MTFTTRMLVVQIDLIQATTLSGYHSTHFAFKNMLQTMRLRIFEGP